MIVSFVLGFLLGKIGSRRDADTHGQRNDHSKGTVAPTVNMVPATAALLDPMVQDINFGSGVPGPPRAPVRVPHPGALNLAAPLPRAVTEPVTEVAQPVLVAALELLPVPSQVAQIKTRTGTSPNLTQLVDPYAELERVWSRAESVSAMVMYRSGKSLVSIAQAMKIDLKQVAIHLIRVVLKFEGEIDARDAAPRDGWRYTDDEESKLQSYVHAGVLIQDIAAALERTVLGVGWRVLDRRMQDNNPVQTRGKS